MALVALTNDRWGFRSNCFVCEPANPTGLRIPFFHDDAAGLVRADFTLGEEFSGAPTYVHGGVSLAVLDEAMAWATIAIAGKFAVTRSTTTEFLRPVRVGVAYRVEASVAGSGDGELRTEARILDGKDRVCAQADATFVPLDAAQAAAAVGTTVGGPDSAFVADHPSIAR